MEVSIASDVTHQPSTASPMHQPAMVVMSTPQDSVRDLFPLMRLMISSFLGARQDPTSDPRQSFCYYLHSEIEHLEERETFVPSGMRL